MAGCAAPSDQLLLEEAIERRGGRTAYASVGGVLRVEEGELRGVPYRSTITYAEPNRLRVDLELAEIGTPITTLFDRQRSVQSIGGLAPTLLPAGEARVLRNRAMDETSFWMVGLDDPNLTTERLPAGTFRGRDVESVRIHHWTGYGRTLHFDPETRDLIGAEGFTWTRFGRKYLEVVYDRFETVDGFRVPTAIDAFEGTEPFRTARVVSWSFAPENKARFALSEG